MEAVDLCGKKKKKNGITPEFQNVCISKILILLGWLDFSSVSEDINMYFCVLKNAVF